MNIEPKHSLTKKQKIIAGTAVFALLTLFCFVVMWFIGRPMIRFVSEPEKFRLWVEKRGLLGKIAFVGMLVFQVAIALVPGEPFEIGAGYAFGIIEGTVLCSIGITLGSVIVFLLVRKFGIRLVEIFFDSNKLRELRILKNSRRRNILIFLVFFLPGTPKDLLTYFAGLTDIKLSNFILLASLARLPSVISSVAGGSALGVEEYKSAIIVFVLTLIVSFVGWIIYRIIIRHKKKNQ